MIVYWSLIALSFAIWYLAATQKQTIYGLDTYKSKIREYHMELLLVFFGVLTIVCGLRSGIADTGTYIYTFENYPIGLNNIQWENVEKDQGFYLLSVLYKTYVSTDYHGWLFMWTAISCVATGVAFHKYASDIGFSCYLFMTTTMFFYLINGMRQYVVVSIFFALSCWLEEKKLWKYVILALLLSTIHTSALVMIPVYFLVHLKPWSGYTFLMIVGAIILGLGFDMIFPVVETVLSGTSYSNYSDVLKGGTGSNLFRLVIAAIPVGLSFLCKRQIETTDDKQISIAANMSTMNFALYIVATFTSGMTVGRLTIYFDVYNLILMPWLINNYPKLKDRNTLKVCAILGYLAFFYVQMMVAWGGVPYVSDILNLYIYH